MKTVLGDILDIQEGIIVHGVNCQGKFNSGLAKSIRQKYPKVFEDYLQACSKWHSNGSNLLGQIVPTVINEKLIIISAFTQQYYGRDPNVVYVNYNAIKNAFLQIDCVSIQHYLPIYTPKIGAGLGNGDWNIIKAIIETSLSQPWALVDNSER